MRLLLPALLLFGLLMGPGLWVRWMLARHSRERDELQHTGAGFANLLLQQHALGSVRVESTDRADHYDPTERAIRLTPPHHDRRSLTAMAVAFHEFGHALQHAEFYRPLMLRTRAAAFGLRAQRLSSPLLLASALVASFAPAAARQLLILGVSGMLIGVPIHLITLPVEFDASFNRALPLLREQGLSEADLASARQILLACALTYAAAALHALLDFRRWLRILLRR